MGFSEKKMFFGYEDFVDFFFFFGGGGYILGSFICILGSFLLVKVQNGGYFLGC